MCAGCFQNKVQYDRRIEHLLELYALQKAGYPFGKDDLPYTVWLQLYEIGNFYELKRLEASVPHG